VSDPERPESAGRTAFLELEAVVRNVSEQLAGYRRRALSAESAVRELEQALAEAQRLMAESRQTASENRQAADASRKAAQEAEARAERLEAELASATTRAVGGTAEVPDDSTPASGAVISENAALRNRLAEATDRTRQIGERVRFLRQQLSNGSDR
jgi:chromosome segregation ATPase